MKLNDLRELSKEDILGALGLASKPSASDRLLGTLGIFGVGLLVGAGSRGDGGPGSPEPPEAATSSGEART